jgi:hypothetical protein
MVPLDAPSLEVSGNFNLYLHQYSQEQESAVFIRLAESLVISSLDIPL